MFSKKCEWCKKDFMSDSKNQKFCSKKCFGSSTKQRKVINCLKCGREFKQKSISQKFCSRICSQKNRIKLRYGQCEYCNKEFKISHKGRRFCSHSCSSLNKFKYGIDKKCEYCGNFFISYGHFTKYCNDKCAKKAHQEKSKKIIKKCEECNEVYKTAHRDQKFCSLQCAGKRNSRLKLSAPTKNGKKKITVDKKRSYLSRHNAEIKMNRKLKKGEVVHHVDCDPSNDNPDNLYVFKNNSYHLSCHCKIYDLIKNLLKDNIVEFTGGEYKRTENES